MFLQKTKESFMKPVDERHRRFIRDNFSYALTISVYLEFEVVPLRVMAAFFTIVGLFSLWATFLLFNTLFYVQDDFLVFTQTLHFGILSLVGLQFVSQFNLLRYHMNTIFDYICGPFQARSDLFKDKYRELYRSMMRERKFLFISIIFGIGMLSIYLVLISPFLNSLSQEWMLKLNSSVVDYSLPFPVYTNYETRYGSGRVLIMVHSAIASVWFAIEIASYGSVVIVFSQNICLQLQLLLHSIETLEEKTEDEYLTSQGTFAQKRVRFEKDEGYWKTLRSSLKDIVHHHLDIIQCLKTYNNLFSLMKATAAFCGALTIGLAAYGLINGNTPPGVAIGALVIMFLEIGNMAIFCTYGERISELSSNIMTATYSMEWYTMPVDIRKTLLIIRERSKKDLTMYGFVTTLNMETFSSIMNSSYSFLNLLLATKQKD